MRHSWIFGVLAAALSIVAVSCGGGDGDESAAALTSEPAQTMRRALDVIGDAKKPRDCRPIEALNDRSTQRLVCPLQYPQQRKAVRQIRFTGAEVNARAAVLDYRGTAKDSDASVVLFRVGGGGWGVVRSELERSTRNDDEAVSEEDATATVRRYLSAVEARDCQRFQDFALTFVTDSRQVCRGEFKFTASLAKALRGDSSPRLRHLGGDETFNFFELSLDGPEPGDYTIATTATPEGALRPAKVLLAQRGPG